jgi:hypothetical protein
MMGQIDGALICYQKSALLIEKAVQSEHVMNQGYIRAWIAELLNARGEKERAVVFALAAYAKWKDVCPPRAELMSKLAGPVPEGDLSDSGEAKAEKSFLEWIVGRGVGE